MPRQQPPQRPPVACWLRVRYAKVGPARFASHRDIARTLERAVRRAGLPVASSSGFTPHPRLSYANPAPTGAASHAEYLELGLTEVVDADDVRGRLGACLPDGFPVTSVRPARAGERLADLFDASLWRIDAGAGAAGLAEAASGLLSETSHEVRRESSRGLRVLDVRAALVALVVDAAGEPGPQVTALLAHGEPLVRPDDLVSALDDLGADLGGVAPVFTRLAQGRRWSADLAADPSRGVLRLGDAALVLPPGEDDPRPIG